MATLPGKHLSEQQDPQERTPDVPSTRHPAAESAEWAGTATVEEVRAGGKSSLLKLLLQKKIREKEGVHPLSYGQKGLWFQQMHQNLSVYNQGFAVKIFSEVRPEYVKSSFQKIVDRHASLRSVFAVQDDEPVIKVVEGQALDFDVTDISHLAEPQAHDHVKQVYKAPFDLQAGPLFRVHLFRHRDYCILLLTTHHIVTDGQSLMVIFDEFRECYRAAAEGSLPALPPPATEYRHFVKYQGELLDGSRGEALWEFWKNTLQGELPVLELPIDHGRQVFQTYNGATHRFQCDAPLTAKLKAFARQEGTTLYAILLSGFQLLLSKYSGQPEVLVGSPAANRGFANADRVVGYFVNLVVLRGRLAPDLTVRQLLGNNRKMVLNALSHQEYPFPLLVERLQPRRDPGIHPLFQTCFILQSGRQYDAQAQWEEGKGDRARWGVLDLEPYEMDSEEDQFDLMLETIERTDKITCHFKYNQDLFEGATIARMAGHLRGLLEAMVAAPDARLADLSLLTGPERQQILGPFNETARAYPSEAGLAAVFEAQVRRLPHAPAVAGLHECLTYEQLNQKANRLARYLQEHYHLQGEQRVGLLCSRSVDMVVALLAILKAGACYLPLESSYPPAQLAFMLHQGQVRLLLTDQDQLPQALCGQPVARLQQLLPLAQAYSQEDLQLPIAGSQLAYLIYTSGSSGRPKGVMIEQRSVLRLVVNTSYAPLQDQHLLATGALSFDATTFEVWGMLLNGSCLHVLEQSLLLDTERLKGLIADRGITLMWFTAAWFHQLIEEDLSLFAPLQTVLAGGDSLSVQHLERLLSTYPHLQVINGYGPTENTTFSLTCRLNGARYRQRVPIGRPIANSRVYILDEGLQLLPVGVAGEICLGGPGLARGYWQQPELTERQFVAAPFLAGERLYRTGDRGRWLADGTVEFLGRQDRQLKVRGFRLELAEVEHLLRQHPDVEDALVMPVTDPEGNQALAAYLVTPHHHSGQQWRTYFRQTMPEHMLPHYWQAMAAFPLTGNGKVDRKALPAVTASAAGGPKPGFVPARTPVQARLIGLWEQVLQRRDIGLADNFFELGGHSLKAMKVAARVQKEFDVKLDLRHFLGNPTVAGLGDLIAEATRARFESIKPVPVQPHYELSHAQRRLWILDQLEEHQVAYNIPIGCLLEGNLDRPAFAAAFEKVVQRHESLRTVFVVVDGEPRQQINDFAASAIEVAYVDVSAGEAAAAAKAIADAEVLAPFELARGPLVRAKLLRLAPGQHLFLLTLHHIIADGWSIEVLVQELVAGYQAALGHQAFRPAPLPIQYKDYAAWQNHLLAGGALEAQAQYWQEQFRDGAPVLELPTDFPRPAVKTYTGKSIRTDFDLALSGALQALSQSHGATLFSTLLASVKTLLYRYTAQEDLVIGTPVAARDHLELEDQIGYYANTLAIRSRFSGRESFAGLLEKVQATTRQAYAHQQYPFDQLVDTLQLDRDMSRSPLFDVMVVLENMEGIDQGLRQLDGLTVRKYEADLTVSKFDLNFMFRQLEDGRVSLLLQYSTDLFGPDRMAGMLSHYGRLLAGIVEDSQRPLHALPLLTEGERAGWRTFNDTISAYSRTRTLHQLFEAQVRRAPQAVALRQDGHSLTYGQLNGQANQLARLLVERGVGQGDTVGLLSGRNFHMITGMLAILKAGAAYLPIDPVYPTDRQHYLASHSSASLIVSDGHYPLFEHYPGLVHLDVSRQALSGYGDQDLARVVDSGQLAYTIYTSGSTGRPKGVMIAHHQAVNLLEWVNNRFSVGSSDRLLFVTSMCFDLSVYDIFGTLAAGASLVIARQQQLEQVHQLQALLLEEGITLWDSVPSTLNLLVGELQAERQGQQQQGQGQQGQGQLSGGRLTEGKVYEQHQLRLVLLSGDWIPSALPKRVKDYFPNAHCISLGGATEGTVWSNYYPIDDYLNTHRASIPYGKPIANNFFYILDPFLNLVPPGVVGELYIGGTGVALGYAADAEKTQAAFLADPFNEQLGGRMYRTGDLGRMQADWNMEFIGRKDHQVKIRGFRVELGEIKNTLLGHPSLQAVEVVARSADNHLKQLVVYYVRNAQPLNGQGENGQSLNGQGEDGQGEDASPDALKSFLSARLPDYMMPSFWVEMAALPLTVNGKIDHKALPEPELLPTTQRQQGRNEVENGLIAIWQQVLGVAPVGITDNFFDLGGDSIKAIQIASRLHQQGYALLVRELFQHPTIASVSRLVKPLERTIGQGAVTGEVPLTPIQAWFFSRAGAHYNHFNQSLLLTCRQRLCLDQLRSALATLLTHHDALRMRYRYGPDQQGQGHWQQYNQGPGRAPYLESGDLRGEADAEQVLAEKITAMQESFWLEEGPLLKAGYYQLAGGDRLVLVSHHLVIDGVSWRILLEDLQSLLEGALAGTPVELPLKTDSYQQWARGLQRVAASPGLLAEQAYWQAIEDTMVADLPRDLGQGNEAGLLADCRQESLRLSEWQTQQLLTQVNQAYNTDLNDVLVTALGVAFRECWGLDSLKLMLEGHGRQALGDLSLELTRSVGWYTCQYPVLLQLHYGEVGRQLKEVKERLHQVPGKGLGYGLLRYLSQDGLRAGQAPQVRFNYLGQLDGAGQEGTLLELAPEPVGGNQSGQDGQDFALEVSALVRQGCLHLGLTYNHTHYHSHTITGLLAAYGQALLHIIDHCTQAGQKQLTPSDFGFKALTIQDLEDFFN